MASVFNTSDFAIGMREESDRKQSEAFVSHGVGACVASRLVESRIIITANSVT